MVDNTSVVNTLLLKTIYITWDRIPAKKELSALIKKHTLPLESCFAGRDSFNLIEVIPTPKQSYNFYIDSLLQIMRGVDLNVFLSRGVFNNTKDINYFIINHNLFGVESYHGLYNTYATLSFIKEYCSVMDITKKRNSISIKEQVKKEIIQVMDKAYDFVLTNYHTLDLSEVHKIIAKREELKHFVAPLLYLEDYVYYETLSLLPSTKLTPYIRKLRESEMFNYLY